MTVHFMLTLGECIIMSDQCSICEGGVSLNGHTYEWRVDVLVWST